MHPSNPQRGGAGDPMSPNLNRTNSLQNKRFIKMLKKMKIKFSKQNVLQILNVSVTGGIPGLFRIPYVLLYCNNVNINSSYIGEPALKFPLIKCHCDDTSSQLKSDVISIFFEVPEKDITKAINVLTTIRLDRPFDEQQLCINRNNISKKIFKFKADHCNICNSDTESH